MGLKPSTDAATLDRVDRYEDVPFLFRRMAVTVEVEVEGKEVEAWAYTYTHASHAVR